LAAPQELRVVAAIVQVALQVLIFATGNYGFFSILTCLLAIP
jgi:hypothetical protein